MTVSWWACTESPFENEIKPQPRVLRGQVQLNERQDKVAGVFVWLEGFDLGARTDSAGKFQIEIPTTLTATGGKNLNGAFRLFFYVANYGLQSVEVLVRNGLFEYGHAALNANGDLVDPIRLFKILTIETLIDPPQVPQSYTAGIDVQVTFRATGDSVEIIVPKSVGGLLGGIFFRHVQTGGIFIDIPDVGADTREHVLIGNEPVSRRQVFQLNGANFRELFLPVGDFEVIPFFFIEQEGLPPGLLESLGENVQEPTPEYLKIPFRRAGGAFRVF
jgi:hypothetical protein